MASAGVTTHHQSVLTGWSWASTPAGADAPAAEDAAWHRLPTHVAATTVAAARLALDPDTDGRYGDLDTQDHWFRCTLPPPDPTTGATQRTFLRFDGLATIADAWLDGVEIVSAQSMFERHHADVSDLVRPGSELVIRFASLTHWLKSTKRPRPRWKTRLVEDQHLRWARTALLGRLNAWGPDAPVIGPWRPVRLEHHSPVTVLRCDVRTATCDIDANAGTGTGTVSASLDIEALGTDPVRVTGATLTVGAQSIALDVTMNPDGTVTVLGECTQTVTLWWPHTHGEPALHQVGITLSTGRGPVQVDLGRTGFRTLHVDRGADGDGFTIVVNGVPVFCRGAVWMPIDPIGHQADPDEVVRRLRTMVDGGMNMVRISGTTAYETAHFHRTCDELGIMVWQDLMLANLDVPFTDPAMRAHIDTELARLMDDLQLSPSLAVVCGSSELDQQATMMGVAAAEVESSPLHTHLHAMVARWRSDAVAVVPSSPSGGHLPFTVDAGVGHYYGVGAYQRPLTDARLAGVRFTSECLAFANVPGPATSSSVLGGGGPTHPAWKAAVPRDAGAGWDFEDVRDHYVAELFRVDPAAVRYADPQRYLALGRAAGAHVMQATVAEWRRPTSTCAGAIVWFLNDLADGAGWGLLERSGRPKAAWYGLAQAQAPVALLPVDEGVNGLDLWAMNDTAQPLTGTIEVVMLRQGRTPVASGTQPVHVPARSGTRVRCDAVIGRFTDPTYAYRFGPSGHDAVVATWRSSAGVELGTAFHFPLGLDAAVTDIGLACSTLVDEAGNIDVHVTSRELARFVTIDAGTAIASHDHFHLAPGTTRVVRLQVPAGAARPTRAYATALNSATETSFPIPPAPAP